MLKLVLCAKRRDDISSEEFHRYWLQEHGPLVKTMAKTIGIKRYVQSHRIETPEMDEQWKLQRGVIEPFDGIVELTIDMAAFENAGSPEVLEAEKILADDEAKFIDHTKSAIFLVEEHEILNTL